MKKLDICYTSVISGLVLIAKEQNMFKAVGLNVDFRQTKTGRRTLDYLQKGWVDIGNLVDTNVAHLSFEKKQNVHILAITQTNNGESLIYNPDKGIQEPRDIEGKTVSFIPRTSSHGFFHSFCERYNIQKDLVQQDHVTHDVALKKIMSGDVDAAIMWEPYSTETLVQAAQTGMNLRRFKNDGFYKFYSCLAVNKKSYKKKAKEIKLLMEVLMSAETFIQDNAEESKRIIAKYMDVDVRTLETFWDTIQHEIQPVEADFIKEIKQQAEWIKPEKSINYEKYIDSITEYDIN